MDTWVQARLDHDRDVVYNFHEVYIGAKDADLLLERRTAETTEYPTPVFITSAEVQSLVAGQEKKSTACKNGFVKTEKLE